MLLHGVKSGMEHVKPPEALILSVETNNAEAWRRWKMSWGPYKVWSGLDQKDENIQVATLLHVLGKECVEIFSIFPRMIGIKLRPSRESSKLIVHH